MEIKILSEKENKLLERKDIIFEVDIGERSTPKLEEVRNLLIAQKNLDPNLTVIDRIDQEYGINKVKCYAKVYDNENALKVELRQILKKNFGEERTNKILGVKKKKEKQKAKTEQKAK
ncbi:MAG: 30S ribosomal protein S24e [Candidatus Altarchaeaceae archaeon]